MSEEDEPKHSPTRTSKPVKLITLSGRTVGILEGIKVSTLRTRNTIKPLESKTYFIPGKTVGSITLRKKAMPEKDKVTDRQILLSLCASIALNGEDVGDIAEDVLMVLEMLGFSQEDIEEHMKHDLLSAEWFEKRNIPFLHDLGRK